MRWIKRLYRSFWHRKKRSEITANKTVFIDKYTDTRRFATNASTPDQPTYNPRAGLDDDAKSRIIARKRDGFGKALGDILLKDNLTTEKLVRNIVAQSFVNAGYNVVTEDPENKAIKCNITVNKLWGGHLLDFGLLVLLQIQSYP